MHDSSGWDWSPGKKEVVETAKFAEGVQWVEEFYASPDGEKLAAVVCTDAAEFGVSVNGEFWSEDRYEKAILPRYTPAGALSVVVSQEMEWSVAVDGERWAEGYSFVMKPFYPGESIAAGVQQDMRYGMTLNGQAWETLYDNANQFSADASGQKTAAAVQTEPLAQADIFKFQSGIFTVAVDGVAWDEKFVNCYTPVFTPDGSSVAAQVRRSLYDYTIAVDGKVWGANYQCVWEPVFNPATGKFMAPVRVAGKWGLADESGILWDTTLVQLWHMRVTADGGSIYGICAPKFGQFTVIKNKAPWDVTFDTVTDLTISPDGERACAIGRGDGAQYSMMVDGKVWNGTSDMLFVPAFSPDSAHVAVRADRGGRQFILVDGKAFGTDFDQAFDPVFSPDSSKVLVKGVTGGKFVRIVADLKDF